MTEKSMIWAAPSVGDGASAYTSDEFIRMMRSLFNRGSNAGVLVGVDNALAVSGSSSPLSVATGAALVAGLYYWNDAAVNVTVSTPSGGTTGHRVILRADWSARTVRIVLKSSPDGTATLPALTQTIGTTYEISLAGLTITTGGAISLTDERTYLNYGGYTLPNAHDALSISDTEIGNGVPFISKRQGNSASDWSMAGTTNYTPAKTRVLAGVFSLVMGGNSVVTINAQTFPEAFLYPPIMFFGCDQFAIAEPYQATATSFRASVRNLDTAGKTINVFWVAIGEVA